MSYKEHLSRRSMRDRAALGLGIVLGTACVSDGSESTSEAVAALTAGQICTGASPCGVQMTVLDTVPACSNGFNMGTGQNCNGSYYWGGRYQCVEYSRRYLCEKHRYNTGPTDCYMLPAVGSASEICDISTDPHLDIHPLYDGYTPQHGDLYVEAPKSTNNWLGHVAVIDYVTGGYFNWTLATVEQNAHSTGRYSYAWSGARCIVHWK